MILCLSGRGWYEQLDELPEPDSGVKAAGNSNLQGSRHCWHALEHVLIMMKRDSLLWRPVTGNLYEYQRGDG